MCTLQHLFDCRGDHDNNGLDGDVAGFNARNAGDVRTFPGHPERRHGAEVGSLSLGGRALLGEMPELAEHLGLTFVRVFSDESDATVPHFFRVDEGTLSKAISAKPIPDVVNVSVGGSAQLSAFEDALRSSQKTVLVVVAAGNEGKEIGDASFYPAYYGSDPDFRSVMLVVGACGPDDKAATLTNRGRDYVDLLAPGLSVPYRHPGDAGTVLLNGTSFATPLASFTAGILRSFGLDTATRIRTRLQASRRWVSDEVEGMVRSADCWISRPHCGFSMTWFGNRTTDS